MSQPALKLPKTIEDFKKAFDPLYIRQSPNEVYEGMPVKKGTVRFLITAAQNATPVDPNFWQSLLQAQLYYKAHLSVIPYRYKNPTSIFTGSQANAEYFDTLIKEYLCNTRRAINQNLVVIGDVKIVPTAKDPLQGFEGFTGAESSIIGHPNLAFSTVATPGHKMAKLMTTTGSCTVKNYSDSRAGKSGEHNHVFGAVIVEVDGPHFWLRHLNANDKGEFIDYDKLFTPKGVFNAPSPAAIVLGDTHVATTDPIVDEATFGNGGIVPTLRPKKIVWHDLDDGFSHNKYHKGKPFINIHKTKSQRWNVEKEVRDAVEWVINRTPEYSQSFIVGSNHNEFLTQWIESEDWKSLGKNAAFYLKTAAYLESATEDRPGGIFTPSPFNYWVHSYKHPRVTAMNEEDSLVINGIECGMHGHLGVNGSRGSLANLVKIGVKFIIGHVHGPGIKQGGMAVGLSAVLAQEYAKGPSNWMQTHALIHDGPCAGKRQLITIVDGKPRLEMT